MAPPSQGNPDVTVILLRLAKILYIYVLEKVKELYSYVLDVVSDFVYGTWAAEVSKIILGLIKNLERPIEMLGNVLEGWLNAIYPRDFPLSVLGYLDPRVTLQQQTLELFPTPNPMSRANGDVCAMAAKLAYESQDFFRDVVDNKWNKNAAGAAPEAQFKYNGYLNQQKRRKKRSIRTYLDGTGLKTSAGRLQQMIDTVMRWCDKWGLKANILKCALVVFNVAAPDAAAAATAAGEWMTDTNAHVFVRRAPAKAEEGASSTPVSAVVVAFRGTEPFSASDWMTDFSFDSVDVSSIGRVHKGFLKALGISSSEQIATFNKYMAKAAEEATEPPHHLAPVPMLADPPLPQMGSTRAELQREVLMCKDKTTGKAMTPPLYFVLRDHVLELLNHGCSPKHNIFAMNNNNNNNREKEEGEISSRQPETKDIVQLFVTGHSLGGALAALFTSLLVVDSGFARQRLKALYTFGQPRVGDISFSWKLNNRLNGGSDLRFIRVLHCNDIVPRVPFDDARFQFKHVGPWFRASTSNRIEMGGFNDQPKLELNPLVLFFASTRQLVYAILRWLSMDGDIKESGMSLSLRFLAFMFPWLVDHSPVNYVNAMRRGLPDDSDEDIKKKDSKNDDKNKKAARPQTT